MLLCLMQCPLIFWKLKKNKMDYTLVNRVKIYAPNSRKELIEYAFNEKGILVAVNAEKIIHATEESRQIINNNIGYTDGIGAVWALKKKGYKEVIKIPGCELWLDVIENYYKTKSFYVIGGKQEIIEETVEKLKTNFKSIKICNFRNGYIKTIEEENLLFADIKKHKPDIIFVAMGSPKQEFLMQRIQEHHKSMCQGLGGSLDVYTNNVRRAPLWWVKNNLEWAYRLISQPKRIKRQIHLVRFIFNLIFKY